jgi:hypothetical protein
MERSEMRDRVGWSLNEHQDERLSLHPARYGRCCASPGASDPPPPGKGEEQRISPFAGAAMRRYSWTNNRQPVFSARLAGRYLNRVLNTTWSMFSLHRNK